MQYSAIDETLEIITIGDSPVTKNPPPLIPPPSTGLTGVQSFAPYHVVAIINRTPSCDSKICIIDESEAGNACQSNDNLLGIIIIIILYSLSLPSPCHSLIHNYYYHNHYSFFNL